MLLEVSEMKYIMFILPNMVHGISITNAGDNDYFLLTRMFSVPTYPQSLALKILFQSSVKILFSS